MSCALASVPEPVQDTPEVAAAKAHFFAQYEAAAHAAAVAPDYDHYAHPYAYGHLGYASHGYAHPLAYAHHGCLSPHGCYGAFSHGFPYTHVGHLLHKRSVHHKHRPSGNKYPHRRAHAHSYRPHH